MRKFGEICVSPKQAKAEYTTAMGKRWRLLPFKTLKHPIRGTSCCCAFLCRAHLEFLFQFLFLPLVVGETCRQRWQRKHRASAVSPMQPRSRRNTQEPSDVFPRSNLPTTTREHAETFLSLKCCGVSVGQRSLKTLQDKRDSFFCVCVAEFNRRRGLVFPRYYLTVRACSVCSCHWGSLPPLKSKAQKSPVCGASEFVFSPLAVSTRLANWIVSHFYLVCNHDAVDYWKINVWLKVRRATAVGNFINNNTPRKTRFLGGVANNSASTFLPFPAAPHT